MMPNIEPFESPVDRWPVLRANAVRTSILFLFHAVVFAVSYVFAFLVRFEFDVPADHLQLMRSSFPTVLAIQLATGVLFGFYRGWWRYVGIADVVRLVFGLSTALVVLIGGWYIGAHLGLESRYSKPPRGVLLIDWSFALLTLFGARVAIRIGRDRFRANYPDGERKRVVIVGAGDAGETLAREIEHRPQLGLKVVAFIDDYRSKIGSSIRGIPIRGPIADIAAIVDDVLADEAFIAIPSASGKRMREIVHHLAEANLSFKTIPGIDHFVTGKAQLAQLRPVNIEDLIRRERIDLPGDRVRDIFGGKRVLVTGAGGTIGAELASQVLKFEPSRLDLVERSEFALYAVDKRLACERKWLHDNVHRHLIDIRDERTLTNLLNASRPDIVLHAAAHKHVPLGEENPDEYLRNNSLATRRLAELCEETGVRRFVAISTDKAINPTSVMGASKRAAEILLMDLAAGSEMKITAVRFGNVLGSSGSVVPLFMEQITAGGPITVTHPEVTRYFLRTSEAVSLVLQAAALGEEKHGCVMMLDMGEPLRIADLAKHLIELSGRDDVEIAFTGLRPGEKLFEEIRLDGEFAEPTAHPQIVVTRAPQPSRGVVADWIERATRDIAASPLSLLHDLVGEYRFLTTDAGIDPGSPLRLVGSGREITEDAI